MKRLVLTLALLLGPAALGRPDCMRNCAMTLKNFEKQCKETNKQNPQGCELVAKQFDQTCKQSCATGGKPKKPTKTSSF